MSDGITGGCLCGEIRYECQGETISSLICHCTDCQSLSGSAFRTVAFTPPDGFELTTGTIRTYVKTAASGNPREQGFCPECGSAIYATAPGDGPKVYGLRVGTITQRRELAPKKQLWHRSALPWVDSIADLPHVDGQA